MALGLAPRPIGLETGIGSSGRPCRTVLRIARGFTLGVFRFNPGMIRGERSSERVHARPRGRQIGYQMAPQAIEKTQSATPSGASPSRGPTRIIQEPRRDEETKRDLIWRQERVRRLALCLGTAFQLRSFVTPPRADCRSVNRTLGTRSIGRPKGRPSCDGLWTASPRPKGRSEERPSDAGLWERGYNWPRRPKRNLLWVVISGGKSGRRALKILNRSGKTAVKPIPAARADRRDLSDRPAVWP